MFAGGNFDTVPNKNVTRTVRSLTLFIMYHIFIRYFSSRKILTMLSSEPQILSAFSSECCVYMMDDPGGRVYCDNTEILSIYA